MSPIAGFARPAGTGPCDNDVVDQSWSPAVNDLWTKANMLFPGQMDRLLDTFKNSIDRDGVQNTTSSNLLEARRSLLKGIYSYGSSGPILQALTGKTKVNYTEKISSLLLHLYSNDERITATTATKTQHGAYDASFVRLGSIGVDENATEARGLRDRRHGVKQSLYSSKSLQLVLLFNELVGSYFSEDLSNRELNAYKMHLGSAWNERWRMRCLFLPLEECFDNIFSFTEELGTGIEITAGPHKLPTGGQTDFSVKITATNSSGRFKESATEYPAIIEFKRPNAGLEIAWKLLKGHSWTKEEKDAFFKLESLTLPDKKDFANYKLRTLQTDQSAMWTAARTVFEKVESNHVDVKYNETKPGSVNPCPSYFTTTRHKRHILEEDITKELDTAGLKTCLDNCHHGLTQVIQYATLNNCSRVAIADGLTFIAGSYKNLTKCRGSNPGGSQHVLDAHFDSTFVMQTYENDSFLYFMNYLCDAVMSSSRFRYLGYQILRYAGELSPDKEISSILQKALFEKMRQQGKLVFNSRYHNVQRQSLKSSQKYLTSGQRMAIAQFLASLPEELQELSDDAASADFAVCEWFRESNFLSHPSYGPFPGRSKSVAKVQFRSDVTGKQYVLKEYFGDEDSIARMKVELDAYCGVWELDAVDQKHVAELKALGSLDLEEGLPRLFLLLEYVEEPDQAPVDDDALLDRELTKVNDLLKSVGVHHNDLEERNYRWQRDSDGSWYIKVFDFDHAEIEKPTMKRKRSDV